MAEPKYVPRDFCAEPSAFGKAATVGWRKPPNEAAAAFTRAAQLQHLYARRIRYRAAEKDQDRKPQIDTALGTISGDAKRRARIAWARGDMDRVLQEFPVEDRSRVRASLAGAEEGIALRQLANRCGIAYVTLMRVLRGETVLHLDHIAWADVVLGEISELGRPRGR